MTTEEQTAPKSSLIGSPTGRFTNGEENETWTKVIRPTRPWFDIDLQAVWRYRDLVVLFVRRDFVATYKQTILGPVWFFIVPIFTTAAFTIVFGKIAKIPTDGVPHFLFYMSGVVCWGYFNACFGGTNSTFVANAGLFRKVYFPRLVVPVSVVISGLFKFLIQFFLYLAFLAYFLFSGASISPNLGILAFPLLVLQMALLGLGCGIVVSSMTTRYRDMTVLVGFGMQIWMYATPIVYPLSQIPEKYRIIAAINPMVAVVEGFRQAFLGTSTLTVAYVVLSWAVTLIIFLIGLILFTRIENTFMDTV